MTISGNPMHRLQSQMEEALASGRPITVADFGGLSSIINDPAAVADSRFASEFVALVMDESGHDADAVAKFVAEVVTRVRNDIAVLELVDALAARAPLPGPLEFRCFANWLGIANSRENPASLRSAALRGALLMKRQDAKRAARLAGDIASTDVDDDPAYLAHAARIGGYLHAEFPSPGIVAFLEDLLDREGASDEAAFELGMSQVGQAFAAPDSGVARKHFRSAQTLFERACSQRESRFDAQVLAFAIGALDDFYDNRTIRDSQRREDLCREAFAYASYSAYDDDFWGGAKSIEIAAWASLAIRLETLGDALEKSAWLNAIKVIESELLAVYSASRSIFRRSIDGGLEWLVRPRIESYVRQNRAQLFLLREWLQERGQGELGPIAEDLIARTDAELTGPTSHPSAAAPESPRVAAILGSGELPYAEKEKIARAIIADVGLIEQEHLSPTLVEAMAAITEVFMAIPAIATVPQTRALVGAIAYKTLLFLESRLDMTPGIDATVRYLFSVAGQPDPLEKDLQQDFMRFLQNARLGTMSELAGVGGGRADISHNFRGSRFVTEVKRESTSASFDNLLASYGEQTVLYQITNVPFGILLVLDLTTRKGLSGGLKSLYKPVVGDLLKDGETRGVLIVRVPGKRISPSGATAAAKASSGHPRRKQKTARPPSSP